MPTTTDRITGADGKQYDVTYEFSTLRIVSITPVAAAPQPPQSSGLAPPLGYDLSKLIFEDRFTGPVLDPKKWIAAIADQHGVWRKTVPAPYSAIDQGGYNAEYFDPAQVTTGPDGLRMKAERSTRFPGYSWKSGCICTHGLFSFAGGYCQVRMKQPDVSSGAWPGIWFLEGGAEIDAQEGGNISGAIPTNRALAVNLHSAGNSQAVMDAGTELSTAFHTYGMEYRPGQSVKFYFDGALKKQYTASIPTGAMTVLINMQMAQNTQGWHTMVGNSTPAALVMQVSDVQVYKL